jgi:hypothetical protein
MLCLALLRILYLSQQDTEKVTCKLCGATLNTVEERDTHNKQQHPEEMARRRREKQKKG